MALQLLQQQNITYSEDELRYIDEVINKCGHNEVSELTFLFTRKPKRIKGYLSNSLQKHGANIFTSYCQIDAFFTPNTFKLGSKTPLQNGLFNVYCLALDVDFKDHANINKEADPTSFFWDMIAPLCGSVIPKPSYIETGHQLRLIYVLNEPIRATNRKMLNSAKVTVKRLSDALNDELNCGCEPQKLSSYFRLPLTINKKDKSTVHIISISNERYTLQEIMDEYLPALPEWYDTWKSNKKSKKVANLHNQYILWCHRLDALKDIQSNPNINRQNTCFLYAQALIWTKEDMTNEELLQEVLAFNAGFAKPLSKKEISSPLGAMIKSRKKYKFKNEVLSEYIGVELDIQSSNARAEKRAERIANGDMRWQKTDAKIKQIKELKEAGKTNKQISEIMGLSVRQIQKLNKKEV